MSVRTARRWRRVGLLVLVLGVVLVVLWSLQRRMIYFPGGTPPPVSEVLPSGREVTLATEDGLEHGAWFVDAPGPVAAIVFPGNAGNRANRAPLADALSELGVSVLLVDYRGYGGNPGSPSEEGLLADARAAAAWVDRNTEAEHTVYFGESLGTGVAVGLATERDPAALILRSPFPSLVAVARQHYGPVPGWILRDHFELADQLRALEVPTLVVAGDRDTIIPLELSRHVADAAAGPSRFVVVEGAGHNDRSLLDGPELMTAIHAFLERHLPVVP